MTSVADEPDWRIFLKAAWPGVSRKVTVDISDAASPSPESSSGRGTSNAVITWVMPPASVPATLPSSTLTPPFPRDFLPPPFWPFFFLPFFPFAVLPAPLGVPSPVTALLLNASISVVLPWSTCPMMLTTGLRGGSAAYLSSSSVLASSSKSSLARLMARPSASSTSLSFFSSCTGSMPSSMQISSIISVSIVHESCCASVYATCSPSERSVRTSVRLRTRSRRERSTSASGVEGRRTLDGVDGGRCFRICFRCRSFQNGWRVV
mmetsp:Transcript_50358/g.107253  ORF Transcript_50358/g.107253 Transcript_50358/m.107253 type:complete len:264 (-) Transcript_50358:72-863(-)